MIRPGWDAIFSQIAQIVSRRGTCPRARVGCVVATQEHQIVSIGYNGAPTGMAHCEDVGCLILPGGGCGRAVHAEINALMQAGPFARGSILYSTLRPCLNCSAALVNAGIVKVVYSAEYNRQDSGTPDPVDFLKSCGIEVVYCLL
jgi:dCMP deaminase